MCYLSVQPASSLRPQPTLNPNPSATYPHQPTQVGEPSGLQLIPSQRERKSSTAICAPSPVNLLELQWKKCQIPMSDLCIMSDPSCGGATGVGRDHNRGQMGILVVSIVRVRTVHLMAKHTNATANHYYKVAYALCR